MDKLRVLFYPSADWQKFTIDWNQDFLEIAIALCDPLDLLTLPRT
ncbi:hypothetical protein [Nostoc spongiaeforme]|nr:hypothetical protein [Nostoc spongiaeforme]